MVVISTCFAAPLHRYTCIRIRGFHCRGLMKPYRIIATDRADRERWGHYHQERTVPISYRIRNGAVAFCMGGMIGTAAYVLRMGTRNPAGAASAGAFMGVMMAVGSVVRH
jgi:hypothetical protein